MHSVAIIKDGFLATYREPLFDSLNRLPGRRYVVFYGDPPPELGFQKMKESHPFPTVKVRNRTFKLLGRRVFYQPLVRKVMTGGFDVVILGYEFRLLSNLAIFWLCKLARKPVLFWGHGFEQANDSSSIARLLQRWMHRVKLCLARAADGYIAYSDAGKQALVARGIDAGRVTVARNTIDVAEARALRETYAGVDEVALREEFGLGRDTVVLLYLGRIYSEKRLDVLLDLMTTLRERRHATRVELAIVGDGEEATRLQERYGSHGDVHWLGAIYDAAAIARLMRVAAAVVIPGAVGLAINHAFAHGVPLITRVSDLHGPEAAYLVDGLNGRMVDGDADRFAHAVAAFADSPETRRRLAAGALETAETLSLEHTVAAFDRAVVAAIERRTGRPVRPDGLQRDLAG
jgi:glycosyltransferase involved in cell wall biosynthesis